MLHTLMSPTCVSLSLFFFFRQEKRNYNKKFNTNLNEILSWKQKQKAVAAASRKMAAKDVDVINELCMQQLAFLSFRLSLLSLSSGKNVYNTTR